MLASVAVGLGCSLTTDFDRYDREMAASIVDGAAADRDILVDGGEDAAHDAASDSPDAEVCAPPIARDTFTRERASGLGAAELGGSWDVSVATPGFFSVTNQSAQLVMGAGQGVRAFLPQVTPLDVDGVIVASVDKETAPGDGGTSATYVSLHVRHTAANDSYYVGVIFDEGAKVSLVLARESGGSTVLERSSNILSYVPGTRLRVRGRVEGTSPTTLRGRLWKDGENEPTAWTLETTDGAPELQGPGSIGFDAYLSSKATNAPVTVTVDDFSARLPDDCAP